MDNNNYDPCRLMVVAIFMHAERDQMTHYYCTAVSHRG
jgi:hypothetical protein